MEKSMRKYFVLDILRSSLFAIVLSILLSLIFSVVISYTSMSDVLISAINIAIRMLSLILGILVGIKVKEKGLLKGITIGMIYVISTYLVFAIISKSFKITQVILIDGIFSIIFSISSGIIAVNIKSKQ